MRQNFNYKHRARGAYILTELEDALKNGDAFFASEADAIRICQRKYKNVSLSKLKADFDYLLENGDLVFEGSRLYLHKVQRYEDFVASELASILPHNVVPTHPMVDLDVSAGVRLNELQKEAIQMALDEVKESRVRFRAASQEQMQAQKEQINQKPSALEQREEETDN